jgi:hypothetical protein
VHFDLTFQLYGPDKLHRPFRDCDPTGKYRKGVDQFLLRSKIAVKRYLEREGDRENLTDEEFERRWSAALAESKTYAEAKAKEEAAAKAVADAEFDAAYAKQAASPGKLVAPDAKVPKGYAVVSLGGTTSTPNSFDEPKNKPPSRREQVEAILERFDATIAQCCYCLYGVELCDKDKLPRRCRDEGGAVATVSSLDSREDCAELWAYVQPYAEAVHDKPGFALVLRAIRRAFPPQNAAPMGGDPVDAYLASMPEFRDGSEGISAFDSRLDDGVSRGAASRDVERALARTAVTRAAPAPEKDPGTYDEDEGDIHTGANEGNEEPAGNDAEVQVATDDAATGAFASIIEAAGGTTEGADPGADAMAKKPKKKASSDDPAVEYAGVHGTLHRFCAAVADVAENDAAFENIADTFPLVLDLLRACFDEDESMYGVYGGASEAGIDDDVPLANSIRGTNEDSRQAPTPSRGRKTTSLNAIGLTTAQAARRQFHLLKADLVHNPARFEGWLALADHVDAMKDLALNDAAKLVTVKDWNGSENSAEAHALVRRLQLALRRATCAAVACAPNEEDMSQAYERQGLAAYEMVQATPPFHDGRRWKLVRDTQWRAALGLARDAFDGAARCAPNEWTYRCHGAKVARKIGEPCDELFDRLKATVDAAPGNLEAFYQMHASRVKFLIRLAEGKANGTMPQDERKRAMETIASHAFEPETLGYTATGGGTAKWRAMDPLSRWDALWADACAAIKAAAKLLPAYHKASYRLAWSRLRYPGREDARTPPDIDTENDLGGWSDRTAWSVPSDPAVAGARLALSPLFKSDNNAAAALKERDACFKHNEHAPRFNIWMWEIDDYNLSVGRGVGGGKRGSYIGPNFRLHTVGVNESGRKFVAASRKATRLYLCLCFAAGDLGPLCAAPGYIGDDKHKHARVMPDLKALAFALAQRGIVLATLSGDEGSRLRAAELGYWMWVEHCGLAWDDLDREGTKEYRLEVSLGQGDREEPAGLIGDAFTSKALDADELIYTGQLNNDNFERIALDHVASLSRLGDSNSMRCLKNMHADITRRVDDAERASRVRTRMGGVPAAPLAQLKTLKPLRKAVFEAVARAAQVALAQFAPLDPLEARVPIDDGLGEDSQPEPAGSADTTELDARREIVDAAMKLRDEVERRAGSAGGATEAEEDDLNAAMELTGSLLVRAVAAATPGAPIPSQSADVMRAAVDAARTTARDICDALTESTKGHKGAGGGGRGGGGRGGGRGRGRGRGRGKRTSDAAQLGAHSERLSKRASIEPSPGLP